MQHITNKQIIMFQTQATVAVGLPPLGSASGGGDALEEGVLAWPSDSSSAFGWPHDW